MLSTIGLFISKGMNSKTLNTLGSVLNTHSQHRIGASAAGLLRVFMAQQQNAAQVTQK